METDPDPGKITRSVRNVAETPGDTKKICLRNKSKFLLHAKKKLKKHRKGVHSFSTDLHHM